MLGVIACEELDEVFGIYIGVASMHLYNIWLEEAYALKTSKYIARGLPVIGTGDDPDFEKGSPYRILVSNDASIDSIVNAFEKIESALFFKASVLREFSQFKLSLESKLQLILNEL